MNKKGFAPILILVIIGILAVAGGTYYFSKKSTPPASVSVPEAVTSTQLEVTTNTPTISVPNSPTPSTSAIVSAEVKNNYIYYIKAPVGPKIRGQISFALAPEDKTLKVSEAGPNIIFTLQKPDGSTFTTKGSLNHFVVIECAAPEPNFPATPGCGKRVWLAGNAIFFDNSVHYDQIGNYKLTASDNQVRGVTFSVK